MKISDRTKNILINLLITTGIIVITSILSVLLLKNMGTVSTLFSDNEYVKIAFDKESAKDLIIPIPVIIIVFILTWLLLYLFNNKKVIYIISIVVLFLISFVAVTLMSQLGDRFVFQLVDNIINLIKNYS